MKTKEIIKLNQWEKRVIIFKFIYSLLIDDSLNKQQQKDKMYKEIETEDEYIIKSVLDFIDNKQEYEKAISLHLSSNWTIERMDFIDKSVIFAALSEYNTHKIDKKIIIDQSIITSKKYGKDNSYKFVNHILDKLLK